MADQEAGPSAPKRCKTSESFHDTLGRFCEEFRLSFELFKELLDNLKQKQTALGTFEIRSCNAADQDCGYRFTRATCSIRPTDVIIAFGSLFIEPLMVLSELFSKKSLSKYGPVRMCVEKLVNFMLNKEIQEVLEDIENFEDDEFPVLLAVHLFSQLSLSPSFTIDKRKIPHLKQCPCRSKQCPKEGSKGKIDYGDTSLGNTGVWHGFIDIIMEGGEVVIYILGKEKDVFKEPDVDMDYNRNWSDFEMGDVSTGSAIAQIVAETIVHSFYFHYSHPEQSQTLVPCIGISKKSVVFYFYDSVSDILLGSTKFPLLSTDPTGFSKLNMSTVFALWMVINHKHLCSGLDLVGIHQVPQSKFLEIVIDKLDVYKEGLRRGGVEERHRKIRSVDPVVNIDSKFIVPEELNFDECENIIET